MSQNWTPPPAGAASATVPNYMVPAIISIFCCWPLAIPAIIFAVQVNNKVQAGDIAGRIEAVSRLGVQRRFEQADVVVVVQRADGQPRPPRQLPHLQSLESHGNPPAGAFGNRGHDGMIRPHVT